MVPLGLDDAEQVVVVVVGVEEDLGGLVELETFNPLLDHGGDALLRDGLLDLLVLDLGLELVLDVDLLGGEEVLQTHALA